MRRFGLLFAVLGLWAGSPAYAVNILTLDVGGGVYDSGDDNIVATSNPFTVYALFNTTKGVASGTYYLSVAIVPKTENPPAAPFGSFKVDGATYSVGNMIYGNPPAMITDPSRDLASHGIFDTHYYEIGFSFDSNKRAELYNSQDDPGGFVADSEGEMLYEDFVVDVSGLAAGYQVHFDLYNVGVNKRGVLEVKDFAPFSHDAQSGPPSVSDTSSTMILLGMAMLAVEGLRRRFLR